MLVQCSFTSLQAEALALEFLIQEWSLSPQAQEWFSVLASQRHGESWYEVAIGVEGLPDKWQIQVYDTGVCEPNYIFYSPVCRDDTRDLQDFPTEVAEVVLAERQSWLVL
jgi:hypothetical protein